MPVQSLTHQSLLGFPYLGGGVASPTTLNAAGTWVAISIPIYDSNAKIKEVRLYFTTLTGTLIASDLTLTLYQDGASPQGVGSIIEGPIACDITPAANSWHTWTLSGTTALTAGHMYFAVIKNANGTPASNNIVIQSHGQDVSGLRANMGSAGCCFNTFCKTTNSGGSWAFLNAAFASRIKMTFDGGSSYVYEGNPFSIPTAPTDSTNMVYATREQGIQFQLPWSSSMNLKVKGVGLLAGNNLGTPAQNARLRIYTGALGSMVLQGTTVDVPKRTFLGWHYAEFATPVSIPANALCSVVLGTTGADTASNTYRLQSLVWDPDTNSQAELPYGSATQNIYFNGTSWAAIGGNAITPWIMTLDTAGGEITVVGSGSGTPIGGRGTLQSFYPFMIGFLPNSTNISPYGMTSSSLNAAANWLALSFRVPPNATQNMKEFKIFLNSITGSLAAADFTATLVASANSTTQPIPNSGTPIETVNCDAVPAAGWNTFTFAGTSAMLPGSNYWIILKNLNSVPASNFPVVSYTKPMTAMPNFIGAIGSSSWTSAISTNSGSTWTTQVNGVGGYRIKFVDGSSNVLYDGFPVSATSTDTVNTVYGTREVGVQFTLTYPSTLSLNVKQIGINAGLNMSPLPSGDLRLRIYTGAVGSMVLQGTTVVCARNMMTEGYIYLQFANAVPIPGNSIVTITISEESNADASTSAWRMEGFTLDTDPNSLPLGPFNGSMKQIYFDGSSWTLSAAGSKLAPVVMILDSVGGEFTVASGGAGNPYYRRHLAGAA